MGTSRWKYFLRNELVLNRHIRVQYLLPTRVFTSRSIDLWRSVLTRL